MNEAFIKHAQHDVDDDDRRQEQDRHGLGGGFELLGIAAQRARHAGGLADLGGGCFNQWLHFAQRDARQQVEREGDRGQLALVRNGERRAVNSDA